MAADTETDLGCGRPGDLAERSGSATVTGASSRNDAMSSDSPAQLRSSPAPASPGRTSATRARVAASVGLAAALAISAGSARAQAGAGAPYGARDPQTCGPATVPDNGPPSAVQAAAYVRCQMEGVKGHDRTLTLITDVQVQVGRGTPFGQLASGDRPTTADPGGLVYPIRGSYKSYMCAVPGYATKAGQNCMVFNNPKAEGRCFRTSFGDWFCSMSDRSAGAGVPNQPPPRE